jgi:hypothetical protein
MTSRENCLCCVHSELFQNFYFICYMLIFQLTNLQMKEHTGGSTQSSTLLT